MSFVAADRCKRGHHSPGDGRLQTEEDGQLDDHCYLRTPLGQNTNITATPEPPRSWRNPETVRRDPFP